MPALRAGHRGEVLRAVPDCIAVLRAEQGREPEGGVADVAAYEPKMNVTPNFIATKD